MSFCFPCFGRSSTAADSEREPLLPKYRTRHSGAEHPPVGQSKPTPSTVDKFLDVLAAFNAGKLPTHDQTARFVQILLRSDLLKLDTDVVASGHGPTSKEGRRVLGDIKGFLQAVLDFGLEKNADDLLQRLYFQLRQIDVEKGIASAINAADKAARETENGAAQIEEYSSIESQIAFDSVTFLCALRTLIESCFKSPSARFLLADLFSIVKDVVALAAADVERAARQVQQAAMEVQHQAQSRDDIIDKVTGASTDDMKEAGKEAADKIADAAKQATHELKDDLTGLGNEASDKTKEKILQRVQEVLSRLQKDRASRSALRAILILARKYAQKILSAAYASETFVSDLAGQAQAVDNTSNYPPQPYSPTATENHFIDAASDQLLQNVNDFLQRISGGHKLDGLLTSLGRVVRDLENAPLALNQEIEYILAENEKESEEPIITIPEPLVALQPGQVASAYAPETMGKGKAKKNRKARMRQKKAAGRAAKISPAVSESQITASVSGQSTPTIDVETSHTPIQERRPQNPLRPYFNALGAYMDRVLDQPGWAASDEGRRSLEILFDDGIELLNVVGGGLLDAGHEAVQSEGPNGTRDFNDDKVRREFKANLQNLINEAETYISAVQQDKTTTGVLEAFSTLSKDLVGLVAEMSKKTTPSLGSAIAGLGGWAAWIGWAIPRILRMLPAGAVPIPTIEVKTGKIEAALHALFIQGFARSGDTGARLDLVPDEIVLTEWTEVRIDMPPGAGEDVENTAAQNVQTTSRLRVHADGVRATVEDVGYYFKYKGALADYEDEGLLSLDVGSEAAHTGIGADIELEFERESDSNKLSEPSEPVIPGIVVRSASGDLLAAAPPHPVPPAPIFRVADVRVALKHLQFRLSHSKHWLLNTVLQPFAGPLVSRLCTHVIEERIRASLEVLATGLAVVARDAEDRRARRSAQENDDRESGATHIADWWRALLAQGPALFGRPTTRTSGSMQNTEPTETHQTSTTATSRGIIHTNVITTVAEPRGTPAMVYNTFTREIEPVDLEARGIGMEPEVVQEEETVVAVGAGPQLFPGKGGPYGSDQTDNRRGIDDVVKDIGAAAADRVREGAAQVAGIEQDYRKKLKKEEQHTDTWKSDAFDF